MLDNILIAASLANLMLMWEWLNAFHPEYLIFNIHSVSPNGIVAFFLVFLSYFFVFLFIFSKNSRVSFLVLFIFFLLPWFHIRNFYHLAVKYPYFLSSTFVLGNWGGLTPLKDLLLLLFFSWVVWRYHERISRILRAALLLFFPFFLITFSQLIWRHFYAPTGEKNFPAYSSNSPLKQKTLWIVFDAFDYNYSFPLREKETTLQFPEIDRFKASNFSFSHAIAPTPMTTYSMSSYFLGKTVIAFNLYPYHSATETFYETGETLPLKDQQNLFQTAKQLGASTAVVGWHLPYCNLFGKDLDYCVWFSPTQWPYQSTIMQNFFFTAAHSLSIDVAIPKIRTQIYNLSLQKGLGLINAGLPNLTLLHFPIPHFPALTESATKFSEDKQTMVDYYSNLEFADKALGSLRSALEKSGQWDSTNIIVTSDHWLRYAPVSYGEKYGKDLFEIPLIIKLAGTHSPAEYSKPLSMLKMGTLVIDTLTGKISNEKNLRDWADKYAVADRKTLTEKAAHVRDKIYHHDHD